MNDLARSNSTSPFDAIRRTRPDGSEYWSARDLMPLLEYAAWRNFLVPIDRAMTTAGNQGLDPQSHFARSRKVAASGPDAEDFELSRLAAYLVAMNGDPNKPAVAAAQAYFAIRTREAETLTINPKELTRADLARMILAAEEELATVSAALKSAEPAIAYHDRYVIDTDVVIVKVWGAQFGLTEPQAFDLLRDKKIIYRVSLGFRWSNSKGRKEEIFEHRARAGRQSFAWFDLRPQHNAPRHHNGQVRQTLYVRQSYALDLGKACGLVPAVSA